MAPAARDRRRRPSAMPSSAACSSPRQFAAQHQPDHRRETDAADQILDFIAAQPDHAWPHLDDIGLPPLLAALAAGLSLRRSCPRPCAWRGRQVGKNLVHVLAEHRWRPGRPGAAPSTMKPPRTTVSGLSSAGHAVEARGHVPFDDLLFVQRLRDRQHPPRRHAGAVELSLPIGRRARPPALPRSAV